MYDFRRRTRVTTYDRDKESGLDYAMNRMYASSAGRMTSPDKGPMNIFNPATLNRYAYGSLDPLNNTDPSGNTPIFGFGSGDTCRGLGGTVVSLFIGSIMFFVDSEFAGLEFYLDGVDCEFPLALPPAQPESQSGEDAGSGAQGAPGAPGVWGNVSRRGTLDASWNLVRYWLRADSNCSSWLEQAYANSGLSYGSFDNFMTNVVPTITGGGTYSGALNGQYTNAVQGFLILINLDGASYNEVPGRSVASGVTFNNQLEAIRAGSPRARSFILLHELGHLLNLLIENDFNGPGAADNQKTNNDRVWQNCNTSLGLTNNTFGVGP